VSDFFTNCERGFPLWAAEAIIASRSFREEPARLHVLIPHEEQARRWSVDERDRYYRVHEAADSVTMLQTSYTDECYENADTFMINRSVMLLTDGGNATTSEYAKSKNKHFERVPHSIAG